MNEIGRTRREFLIQSGKVAAALPLLSSSLQAFAAALNLNETHSYILSPTRIGHWEANYGDPENPAWVDGRWGMFAFDTRSGDHFFLKTPGVGHSIVGHPTERSKILFISQKPGNLCCEIDLKQRKITQVFHSGEGVFFIGHAAFTKDGKWVYFTESQYGSTGFITKRNTKDYKIEKIFPSGGLEPHELRLIEDDKTVLVVNGGVKSKPNSMTPEDPGNVHGTISYLDAATGRVKKTVTGIEERMSPRHIAFASENETYVGLRRFVKMDNQQAPLALVTGDKVERFSGSEHEIEKLKSWLQSVAFSPESGLIAASAPDGHCVAIWDRKERKLVKTIDLFKADGLTISPDRKKFIATSHPGKTLFIDCKTLAVSEGPHARKLNWRHCLAWDTLA